MLKEIEALLREIAEQQGLSVPDRPKQRRPGKISASGRPIEDIEEAEVIDAEPVEAIPVREDLQSHVRRHMDTTDVTEHVAHLGETVGLADDKLESRLHHKFDHALGSIHHDEDVVAAIGPSMASDIVEMFRNPADINRAIILNEILSRPDDHWP